MGSLAKADDEIPRIDFSKEKVDELKAGGGCWRWACKEVRRALEEYGCFVAEYPQVSGELSEKIFGESRDLFDLPTETKMRNTSTEPYRGYIGPNPLMPLYEGLAIDDAPSPQQTRHFMNLMWPHGKHQFCEVVQSHAKLLGELDEKVLEMLMESYGIKERDKYESIVGSNSHLLRFIKYRKPEDDDTELRYASHTDKNFTTIVCQDKVAGLEVRTKQGLWLSIHPSPSSFLFMAADGLQVWSNDRIKACYHRVKHCGDEARYSLGLFTFNNGVIRVPDELVDEDHPLLYNPFDSRAFLRFYLTDEAKKAHCPMKALCGTTAL